ncbi:hypothetical protein QQF64_033195 [Cirrhinus molitorella]|uniref:Uncharacterized protein n=1 Tax=Cirrhinus molitorella TaxID=172907 RepID=A0ABR3MTC0_9TELE
MQTHRLGSMTGNVQGVFLQRAPVSLRMGNYVWQMACYHTFSVNLLSVPACGLEIPGHVAKRQVPILFFLVAMVRGKRVGPE